MGRNDTNFLVPKDSVPPTLNPSERTLWFWRSFPTTRNTRQQHSLSLFRPEKQRHKSKASMKFSFWSCHRVKSLGIPYQSSSIQNSIHTVVSNSAKFYPDVVFRKYTISTLFLWDLEVATGKDISDNWNHFHCGLVHSKWRVRNVAIVFLLSEWKGLVLSWPLFILDKGDS